MPKYMFQGSYTQQGAAGLIKEGGTSRREAVEKLVTSVGGSIEALYWTLGSDDVIVIADMPDVEAVAAASLTVSASGAISLRSTPLVTASQLDDAAKRSPQYRPPGG